MGKKGFVEGLGAEAQKEIIQMSVQGLSSDAIKDEICMKYGIPEFDSQLIQKYLARQHKKRFEFAQADKNWNQKLVKEFYDTVSQQKELLSSLWKVFNNLEKQKNYEDHLIKCHKCGAKQNVNLPSYSLLLRTSREIMNMLRHIDRLAGKTHKAPFKLEVNYVQMTNSIRQNFPTMAIQLEKAGVIKILKKRKLREMEV